MPNAFGFRLWSRLLRMAPAGIPAGVHRQTRVGTGFDLSGIRPFEPGDDPRRLDAGATARRGFPHVRDDRPSPSQALHFVVEGGSRLTSSPSPSPLDLVREVISLLAPVALSCGDPVGLTSLGDKGLRHLPPRRDPAAGHACMAHLLDGAPSANKNFDLWEGLVPRGALALILTDGLSRTLPLQLTALTQRAEVRLLLVRHPWIDEPPSTIEPVVDPESGAVLPPPSKSAWKIWRQKALEQMAHTTEACRFHRETPCNYRAMETLGSLLAELLMGQHP